MIQGIVHEISYINDTTLLNLKKKLISLHGNGVQRYIDLNVLICPDGEINPDIDTDNVVVFFMDNMLAALNVDANYPVQICEITYKTSRLFTKRILEYYSDEISIVLSLDERIHHSNKAPTFSIKNKVLMLKGVNCNVT